MTISRSQMTKQMENNVDKFKPMKDADYEKLTPAQKKAYDAKAKKAMMGNLPSPPKKKMMAGGMAKNMPKMASGKLAMVKKGGKKVPFYAADGKGKMMDGGKVDKPKRGQRAATNKMAGGKVRGYGMARGGKVCKMR